MFRSILRCFLSWALLGLLMTPTSAPAAETLKPSWRCLPEETLVAVRIPDGLAFAQAFKKDTKMGAVFLEPQRIEQLKKLIAEHATELHEKLGKRMEEYGLQQDDSLQMLAGESGMAVLGEAVPDSEPRMVVLFWCNPGPEVAARMMVAVTKAVGDQPPSEKPVERVDVELAGQSVMHLTLPSTRQVWAPPAAVPMPPIEEEPIEGQQSPPPDRAPWDNAQGQPSFRQVTQFTHLLLTRIDGRLLAATTQPREDKEQGVAELTATFARFLAAHQGEDGTFAARMAADPAMNNALPQGGAVGMEVFGDLAKVMQLASQQGGGDAARMIKALGLERLGLCGLRLALEGSILRSGALMSAPAPRTGIPALMDQPVLAPQPLNWVPTGLMGYAHISADLGNIYKAIRQMVVNEVGAQAEQGFQMAEMQVQMNAQAELPALLSALGHQHAILNYEPRFDAPEQEAEPQAAPLPPSPRQRLALVWQLKDEALWTRLLQTTMAMAGQGGPVQAVQEQGFNGWRIQAPMFQAAVFIGKGMLVYSMGPDVVEQTLSSINTPPKGPEALHSSPIMNRAAAILPMQPGLMFQVSDGSRSAKVMRKTIEMVIDQIAAQAVQEMTGRDGDRSKNVQALAQGLKGVLPTEQQMQDMVGVGTGYVRMTDAGMEFKGATELPAP